MCSSFVFMSSSSSGRSWLNPSGNDSLHWVKSANQMAARLFGLLYLSLFTLSVKLSWHTHTYMSRYVHQFQGCADLLVAGLTWPYFRGRAAGHECLAAYGQMATVLRKCCVCWYLNLWVENALLIKHKNIISTLIQALTLKNWSNRFWNTFNMFVNRFNSMFFILMIEKWMNCSSRNNLWNSNNHTMVITLEKTNHTLQT